MKKLRESKSIIAIILLISISVMGIRALEKKRESVPRDILDQNLKRINDEANSVYEDIQASKKKYLDLLEVETDPFKRGMYSSALVQVYTAHTDFDKVNFYGNQAIEEYIKVPGGEYYAMSESTYLAFSMLGMGLKTESFAATNSLLEMINSNGRKILNDKEIMDREVIIYTIFLSIYSEFKILDMAEIYYNKLSEMEVTPEIYKSIGDRIDHSKLEYALSINDIDLINKYAHKCYNISLERDKEEGINTADSVILNVAEADIMLGNLDNVIENIKKAEDYYNLIKDERGLTYVYNTYSDYYEKIGDLDKSNEYLKKSVDKAEDFGNDYLLINILESYISFLEKHGLYADRDIKDYYKKYHYLVGGKGDEELQSLVSEIVKTNEKLNQSRLLQLEDEALQNKIRFISAVVMILILGVMLVVMKSNIKKKNMTEMKLEKIANKDYLTGVNTRAYGYKLILNLIKNKVHFSLSLLDIDNFKSINDTFGHMFGDEVLKTIADKIKEKIDNDDIVIRFGGEEFIVIFVNCTSIEAKGKLDKIREDINEIIFDNEVRVSISAGIKEWDNTKIEDVIDQADKLLYKAKSEGKNRVNC